MTAPRDGNDTTSDSLRDGRVALDFEMAQRNLFAEVGLDEQSQFIDLETPRVRTHVFEAGSIDEGPPVVFVHGTASFGAFLAPLMARLDDVRVLGFDRPGYGLSDAFVYTEGNIRQTVVDVLAGVLDEMGIEQVDLVGHSMGGYASLLFALVRPDRVRHLFLVGSVPAFPGTHPPIQLRLSTLPVLDRIIERMQKPGIEGVLDIAAIFGERDTIQHHPELIRAIAAHEADPKSAEAGRSEFAALFSIRGWHSSIRIQEDELRHLQHPATIVWGDHDPLGAPDAVRDGVAVIPDARFEIVDSGHIPFLAHSERCARLIREVRDGETEEFE